MWVERNMENAKLNRWAELLLDTGKRNRLVNYQDTKASTVEVVYPDAAAAFEKVGGTSSFEVYNPKLEGDEISIANTTDAEQLEIESDLMLSGEVRPEKMDRASYIATYSGKLRKESHILLYNKSLNPITALKNIDKKSKSVLEETGVNVAYFAFGFIHWKENENSNVTFRAPILLAPVVFKNASAISPYFIELTGDDVVVNPTFNYKISSEYGIKLPEYHDEGLEEYLHSVSDIVSKLDWGVTGECKIGIFSFLKMNMYRDLKDNAQQILQSDNVLRLLGEYVSEESSIFDAGQQEHHGNEIIDLHTVVDADSSQIEAIEMAKSSMSFVLQGPPGTGKSQTITNIIAECLHDGKKVLFVSEKQAALNVVYNKLKKAGLAEFCLELHSYKANKKDVIDELCHTLRLARSSVSSRAEAEVEIKAKAQKQLDDYAAELHKNRPSIDKSLYQLFEAYAAMQNAPDMEYSIADITSKSDAYMQEVLGLLEQYVEYIPSIGYDFRENVWYGYENQDTSYQANAEVTAQLKTAISGLELEIKGADSAEKTFGITCHTMDDCGSLQKLMNLLSLTDFITPAFFECGNITLIHDTLYALQDVGTKMVSLREELEASFEPEFFQLNAKEINKKLTQLYNGVFSRLFNSDYKALINKVRLTAKVNRKLGYQDAVTYTGKLATYLESVTAFKSAEGGVKQLFGAAYCGEKTDWAHVIAQTDQLEATLSCGAEYVALSQLSIDAFEAAKPKFGEIAAKLQEGASVSEPAIAYICKRFNQDKFDIFDFSIHALSARFSGCVKEVDKIDNWNRFASLLEKIRHVGAADYLGYVIDHNVKIGDVVGGYKRVFYRQWIENVIRSNTVLANFTRVAQDQAVHTFVQKDTMQFEISKAQIKAELSANRPSLDLISSGSAISTLLREGEKKRKQKPIRVLLEETGELVQILKPCFLMSPLSVSTFLSNNSIRFDTIVFDEASQIFPQDAIGAIYRGKQIIVVGDSKQMPPSNFFNATVDSDMEEDEEVGDINDFESILDLCSTSLPQLRLSWHYRSRYEQLIAFSNRNFYDNTLTTFPSAQTDRIGIGVDYYHVDGLFEHRSRTNRAEAEYVVDLIYRNADVYPNRSLGVVAFSVAQQDLIDRLLAKRRLVDSSKESFFSANAKEPFFIKNLETVQGDERDTIIFSIAYGKDAQGRLLHNFGPLNRVGGERRLNVAVSRAKCYVQVVSSMHYSDIDLKRTQSDGARLLREYLDFAENGMVALERAIDVNPFEQFDSAFETEVYDFLKAKGYAVDTQIGCSGYKIDIGLKRPNSSDYVLAIECDGATYHTSKNARDRDRLRQSVLKSMGWQFYRIWSTDWFRNKKVEKERLIQACEDAIFCPVAETATSNQQLEEPKGTAAFEVENVKQHFSFPEYKMAADPQGRISDFQGEILRILKVEAPLAEEWLLKRIVYLFGREKVTNVVSDGFNSYMQRCYSRGIIRRNGFLYLQDQQEYALRVPGDFKRDIKYIAPEELVAGIYTIVKENVTASKDGVYLTIVNLLGFSRCGESIRSRLDDALVLLDNVIKVDRDMLSLKK